MIRTKTVITRKFALVDSQGRTRHAVEVTRFIESTHLGSNNREWTPTGLKIYRLTTGEPLTQKSEAEFQLVGSSIAMTVM